MSGFGMKEEFYKKMEAKFPLISHRYQEVGPLVAIQLEGVKFHSEANASASTGSPVGNRPANRGPSLCQCWGRWTQKAEPEGEGEKRKWIAIFGGNTSRNSE